MEPESTATKTTKRQLSIDCNTLELTNGKATSLLGLSDNQISTNSYLSNNVVLRLFFKLLNPCPLSLIITIVVVTLLPRSEAYPLWMYITEFAMILLLLFVKELYFDMMRRRADEKVNKSTFLNQDSKIYRDGQELTGLCWGDIRQGDILYLEKGQKAPADILVLDTQHIEDREAVVYIDARSITGRVTVQRKKACFLTQVTSRSAIKRNWDKYKKEYLTGKLKYELPNADMEDFLGYLKLVKDPKTSLITFENFISRESIIKTCWIYALVLHAGMNCKIMRHIGERNRNHKFFENYIDRIFAVCFVVNLILGIPYALVALSNQFLSALETSTYHLLIFSVILPHFLYFGNGLLLLYFSLKNNIDAEIINFSSIISLGSIDFAVIAYNGVLSSGKMIADEIITSSSLYDFRQESESIMRGSRRNGSISGSSNKDKPSDTAKTSKNKRSNKFFMSICSSATNGSTPAQKQYMPSNEFETYFLDDDYKQDTNTRLYTGLHSVNPTKFKMQLEPLRISKQKLSINIKNEEEESMELIKAFSMCHQAILKSIDSLDIKFQANSSVSSEEVLLRLVNGIGVHVASQIDSRTKKQVGLRFKILQASKEMFFSRRINNFQVERRIFSVVVREEGFEENIIYCKGSPEDMFDKLKDKELKKNILENKLSLFKNSKAEIIVYGKRVLSNSEYETYDAEFTKLKMSSNVTQKDLQEFSSKFEKDLQFVCMVGLSSEKNEQAKAMTAYLTEKGIKMCIFTNNNAEIQTLKSLLQTEQHENDIQYIELQGITVEQIIYNLNSVTRKLSSQKSFIFSLIVGPKCWKHLKLQPYLMQHFLFAAYYSQNILTHGFTPQQKAEITQKLKISYNRNHTLMSIGSSYSDLLFQNYSDVSLIIHSSEKQRVRSDIPSDIRAPTISSLKKIIQLGSWVTNAYNYLIDASLYRSILIGTVALSIQAIVYAQQGTSYNLNGTLTALYIVVYGTIQTLFTIKTQQKKGKSQIYQKVKDKQYWIKFITNIIQAFIHGVTISVVVLMALPNARFSDGRLFPIEAIHYCIYFLIITVSIFRHMINGQSSRLSIIVLSLVSYPILLGILWILAAVNPSLYHKMAMQMWLVYTVYDSAFMQINAIIFCLACSLYISETRKKGMMSMLTSYYLNLKKGQGVSSKQLLAKDINHIDLVKHLFVDMENIEDSIQELVGTQFDTNQLKISKLLQIKKAEHRIKNEFNNVPLNLTRFKITIMSICILLVAELTFAIVLNSAKNSQLVPLYLCLVIILIVFCLLMKDGDGLGRKYYRGAQLCLEIFCLMLIIYEAVSSKNDAHFLLTCCAFLIFTQLIGLRLQIVALLCVASLITSIVVSYISGGPNSILPLQIFLTCICGAVNVAVLYGSTFDSKKNFILREQIQMQTNQTNDIWTILVPEFVRNFFSETGEQGGQYRQNSVAILFCYVCNFDSIIEEQGRNVVRILDDLYREFDKLCSSFAVQKIETVGYTYMAATGIKKIESQMQNQMVRRNKVERLLGMAQQMLDKTKMFKWGTKKNKDLDIKIGIHVGEVVVGVIGKHKKQFSLIGTNVNTTSRHGSTGTLGSITLSRQAKNEVHFPDEAFIRKDVYMKGLCKDLSETIPVFTLKAEEARRSKTKSNGHRLKFKELVMKIIRSQRLSDEKSSDDGQILANIVSLSEPPLAQANINSSNRELRRRTTCRGLENNFNKIQEMKNRQDEIKCYSSFLQFDTHRAHEHICDLYPGKSQEEIEGLIKKEQEMEDQYHLDLQKSRAFRDKLFSFILITLNIAYIIVNILYSSNSGEIVARAVGLILFGLIFWSTSYLHRYAFVSKFFLLIFTYSLAVQRYDMMKSSSAGGRAYSNFYVMIIITMFSGISGIRFVHAVWMVAIAILSGAVVSVQQNGFDMNTVYEWFYIVLVLIRKYAFQKESIINFRQGRKTAQISNELSKIVSELLPKHAYQKLKTQNFENRLQLTDLFEQCTILFADIKGFTEFSDRQENRQQPQNVVRMLRSLFQEFDVLCTEKNVYKVYTIGDCYVVLGFTNCYDRNPMKQAQNVLSFAFDMLKKIDEVKKQKPAFACLNMRIGIHTGTIIGGIVGTEIVRYDIYGSDVVVANKFQETGKTGEVHVSEETKKLLDQLEKKPYSENNIYPSEKVEVKKLNISYGGYFIKRGNLS